MFLVEWRKTRSKGWNVQDRVRMCVCVCVYLWQSGGERERQREHWIADAWPTQQPWLRLKSKTFTVCLGRVWILSPQRTNDLCSLIRKTASAMQDLANSRISNVILFSNTLTSQATYFPLINNLTMKFVAVVTLLSVVNFWHSHPAIKLAPAHHNPKWCNNWVPI